QPDVPAAAHARAPRHAAPDLDVPPRWTVGGLQPHLVDRLRHHGPQHARLRGEPLAHAHPPQGHPRRQRPLARRHARVVHDLAASAAQLRHRPLRDERPAAARSAPAASRAGMTSVSPGPWLRLCALVASAGTIVAVVSGAAGLGATHRLLAALVAPPLAALLAAAWLVHRKLVPAVLGAALAALLVLTVQCFRGEQVPWGAWRDYVTLTKPRIMSLLLVTGFCGMIAGAGGWPGTTVAVAATVGLALACGGASALNHVLDRDIDPLMGERTKQRPVASGRVT